MQSENLTHSTNTMPKPPRSYFENGQTVTFDAHPSAGDDSSKNPLFSSSNQSKEFDNFTILEEISGGGSGTVFKAQDRLGRIWAIKILREDRLSEEACERFFVEAKKMQALEHPHLLRIADYRIYQGRPFLILPLCKESFLDRISAGNLTIRESVRLMMQATKGLSYLHERGYVHRDIKPGNLLIDQEGKGIVGDLGLLDELENNDTADQKSKTSTFIAGTIPYMKPEVLAGEETKANPTWDLHACGLTLYQMLSGERPPICTSPADYLHKTREEAIPPLSIENKKGKKIPKAFDKIIARCCAKEGGYKTAKELHRDLKNWYYRWHHRAVILLVLLIFGTGSLFATMRPARVEEPPPPPSMLEILEKESEVTLIDESGKAIYPPKYLISNRVISESNSQINAYSIQSVEATFIRFAEKLPSGKFQFQGEYRMVANPNSTFSFVNGTLIHRTEKEFYLLFRSFSIRDMLDEKNQHLQASSEVYHLTEDFRHRVFKYDHTDLVKKLPAKPVPSWRKFMALLDGETTQFSIDDCPPIRIKNHIPESEIEDITFALKNNPFPKEHTYGNECSLGFMLNSASVAFRNVKIIRKD